MPAGFDPEERFPEDRLENLEELREKGVEPYPAVSLDPEPVESYRSKYDKVDLEALEEYADSDIEELSREEMEEVYQEFVNEEVEDEHLLAGEVTEIRDHGGITFADVRDQSGEEVQILLQEDGTEDYDIFQENVQRGDILSFEGSPAYTNTGEISLEADCFDVLTKSLKHPPNRDSEMNEKEKVRNRAVALREDEELSDAVETRFELTQEIRKELMDKGYLEVETPIIQPIYGGANATPFETHVEAKDQDMYLRIAPELYLKRMIVGGMGGQEGVFEVGKVFRNEDIDTTHNPEFTMMELYEPWADYEDMMELTEDLVSTAIEEVTGGHEVEYGDRTIDFSPSWERITMEDSLEEIADIDVSEMDDEELEEMAREEGAEFPGGFSRGLGIEELFEEKVEHRLQDPTFVIDHPVETTPLCKDHREKEGKIERFELFTAGAELANSYTELNDPVQQGQHFAEQARRLAEGDEEAHRMDDDFVDALAHGMPPTGGLGIGIDRLAMLATDSGSIKDVLSFPMVGRED